MCAEPSWSPMEIGPDEDKVVERPTHRNQGSLDWARWAAKNRWNHSKVVVDSRHVAGNFDYVLDWTVRVHDRPWDTVHDHGPLCVVVLDNV